MNTEAQVQAQRTCQVWTDHDFHAVGFVTHGRHPTRGSYATHWHWCSRCGLRTAETRWLDLPKVAIPGRVTTEDR